MIKDTVVLAVSIYTVRQDKCWTRMGSQDSVSSFLFDLIQ